MYIFFNSIIATPLAYEGRYADCNCFVALFLIMYNAGYCRASVAAKAPLLSVLVVLFTTRDV